MRPEVRRTGAHSCSLRWRPDDSRPCRRLLPVLALQRIFTFVAASPVFLAIFVGTLVKAGYNRPVVVPSASSRDCPASQDDARFMSGPWVAAVLPLPSGCLAGLAGLSSLRELRAGWLRRVPTVPAPRTRSPLVGQSGKAGAPARSHRRATPVRSAVRLAWDVRAIPVGRNLWLSLYLMSVERLLRASARKRRVGQRPRTAGALMSLEPSSSRGGCLIHRVEGSHVSPHEGAATEDGRDQRTHHRGLGVHSRAVPQRESISGKPLGLRSAAGNAPNLEDPETGGWGQVLLDPLNST
jgi:hypothetical protein